MRALIAFDKFKDALSARTACELTAGILTKHGWETDACPLTDGGEGFEETLRNAAGGQRVSLQVDDPRGSRIDAGFSLIPTNRIPSAVRRMIPIPGAANIAIIEMAAASGLALLPTTQRNPWQTSTTGTGQLLEAAAKAGAGVILLGIGGSATHDLGLGALSALGIEFIHAGTGQKVSPPTPDKWKDISHIRDAPRITAPPLFIACDVTNPLLGPHGAATTFAPQKGLPHDQVPAMEESTARMAELLCTHYGQPAALVETPGAGAAGGIAFGLMCALHARLCPGFKLVSAWLGLDARIAAADVVITGEGRFDTTSLHGKGPGSIAQQALALGKPVHVFAGAVDVASGNPPSGLHLHALTRSGTPLPQALRETPDRLMAALEAAFGR